MAYEGWTWGHESSWLYGRKERLQKKPPEGLCDDCDHAKEKNGWFKHDVRLCFYYCWKRALDRRRKENKCLVS